MKKKENYRLSIKIITSLGFIIFVIIFIYSIVFDRHYKKYEDKIIGEENIRTLHSLETSIDNVIKNADEYSKMMIADGMIQNQMRTGDLFDNYAKQSEVIRKIYSVIQYSDYIKSVWLIDNNGQKLTVGRSPNISVEDETEYYRKLKKPYGEYVIRKSIEEKKLSLIRSYNNLDEFKSEGIIGVDIDYEVFNKLIAGVINLEREQISILNEKNEIIFWEGRLSPRNEILSYAGKLNDKNNRILEKVQINDTEYVLAGVRNNKNFWKIIRYSPVQVERRKSEIVRFNFFLILAIGVFILLFAAIISSMLTRPIQELLICMKETDTGKLMRIEKKSSLTEFRTLFKGYNHMVSQIEILIESIIEKQRRIRQVELNEIQEQMKPHFLYNSLDSLQALAMMGETEKVCKLVEALGDFYRKSVSGGRELLTIYEEFQIAKDYADIMRMRFENSFDFMIELEESCKDFRIPKLTIQPLVENSFQHGIRVKNQFGTIMISATLENDKLHILVKDNGDGVPNEIISELTVNKEPKTGKSLGLRGTIERLRLLYGDSFTYKILKKKDSEIHLYITISKLREVENGQP